MVMCADWRDREREIHERQCMYKVIFKGFRETTFAEKKQ
jgi:hypothetical protein